MLKKDEDSKKELVALINYRFCHRYLQHILSAKAGFLKMANACLMIETLESFKKGAKNTKHKSGQMFKSFFISEEKYFPGFKERWNDFFENIRCGILHQGETTNARIILRTGPLLDTKRKP
jgi:hypothetical protein